MPFNGSGTYVPPGSPTFPPTAGSVISSAYYTTVINDLGSALSVTFLRDGSLPLGGNLNLGGNKITSLASGAVGALALNFNADATTGLFLNGVGKLSLVSGGTTRVEANSTGVLVTGTLDSTGALTRAGNTVWDAGNFVPVNYAALAGAVFTGGITAPIFTGTNSEGFRAANATPFISFYNAAQSARFGFIQHSGVGGPLTISNDLNAAINFSINGGNAASIGVGGTFNANGAITQNGQQVWYAGNFDPTLKANLVGPTFSGTVNFAGVTNVPTGEVGTRDVPQTIKSAAFSFAATDRGGHTLYNGAAVAATLDPNATTALPIGFSTVVVNEGSGVLTITRGAGVTLNWNGSNANRALAIGGLCTILKTGTNTFYISGTLLS